MGEPGPNSSRTPESSPATVPQGWKSLRGHQVQPGHVQSLSQIHGFAMGMMNPTPDGPEGGSGIPCVLLHPRGRSPGTGHRLEQPQGWAPAPPAPPPAPSPESSMSVREKGIWGQGDPRECPGLAPKPDSSFLCWAGAWGARAAPHPSLHKSHWTMPVWLPSLPQRKPGGKLALSTELERVCHLSLCHCHLSAGRVRQTQPHFPPL